MQRSLFAVIVGTFTLRFSTGLTGAMLVYYLADLPHQGGPTVSSTVVGVFSALFFAAELTLAPPFGLLSDRLGHHRIMQVGPVFGAIAVVLTWLTTNLPVIGLTRLLEGATLAGLGAGFVAAGPIYATLGRGGFLLNALVYLVSLAIYRYGVTEAEGEQAATRASHPGVRRYIEILRSSSVWILAPTWIAINAALGLWTSQSIFQIVKDPPAEFSDQYLMGLADPIQVSVGLTIALVVFFGGLAFWGERFKRYRRTSIIFVGICGGALMIVAATLVNHSAGLPFAIRGLEAAVAAAGLFVLAGATPAALGLLADVSESFPNDRGAIMGVYSVFLALGQITGSLIGGAAAEVRGIDGLLVATLVLLLLALVPLNRLRAFEHQLSPSPDVVPGHGAFPAPSGD